MIISVIRKHITKGCNKSVYQDYKIAKQYDHIWAFTKKELLRCFKNERRYHSHPTQLNQVQHALVKIQMLYWQFQNDFLVLNAQ